MLGMNTIALQRELQGQGLQCIFLPDMLLHPNAAVEEGQFTGTDLFVREDQLATASAILQGKGYAVQETAGRVSLQFWSSDRYMELRWRLPGRRSALDAIPLLEKRCVNISVAGRAPLAPHPHDWLVLQAMRGAEDHWRVLGAVRNIAEGIRACAPMDWQGLLRRARELQGVARLLLALDLAAAMAGIEFPAEVARTIQEHPIRQITPRVVAAFFEEVRRPTGTLADLKWDWPLLDSRNEKLRYAKHFAFTPTGSDRGPLPRLVRPIRLLAKLAGLPLQSAKQALDKSPRSISTYAASDWSAVDGMLALAGVGPNDVVVDLGCGDGRIVLRAAAQHGARAVGIDLDPARIEEAKNNARIAGVSDRVRFLHADIMTVDLSEATVITMFLPRFAHLQVGAEIERRVRPGTRIVSEGSDTGLWDRAVVVSVSGFPQSIFLRVVKEGKKG